jgi:hypothetical protein
MRSTYLLLSPLTPEQAFFHKALSALVRMGRLTREARLVRIADDGEAFVEQGDSLYTIERVSRVAAALRDPDEREIGRWYIG